MSAYRWSPTIWRGPLTITLCLVVLRPGPGAAETGDNREELTQRQHKILQDYLGRQERKGKVVAQIEKQFGKPFSEFTEDEYTRFTKALDFDDVDDLLKWSHVTGIPIIAIVKGNDFFRYNAHLLADRDAAGRLSAEDLKKLDSKYSRKTHELSILNAEGTSLPVRNIAAASVRTLALVGQTRHNEGFSEDRTALKVLAPYLARLDEVDYLPEVHTGIRKLPLSVVKVLRGKAIYLSLRGKGECTTIWHCIGTDLYPGSAGMQPCVFLEKMANGRTGDAFILGVGRLIRETVLESEYFGLYAHPLQFTEFQKLNPKRRNVFGRRRDKLPQTEHGYIGGEARADATANFVRHFFAYVNAREAFHTQAKKEEGEGHPELMRKYEFMQKLVEHTPTTLERLSREFLTRVDPERQRGILQEYLARQAEKETVRTNTEKEFGKPFPDFTREDYARFMKVLDLNNDDDLWKWSHVTDIPFAALNKRSITFHKNSHLLADTRTTRAMSYRDMSALRSSFDRAKSELRLQLEGRPLKIRDLPEGVIRLTTRTGDLVHNKDFAEDRIVYEALEPCLVRLSDLENREEISEGIRMLPLSIVKAHRGKAFYPTTLSRTGWAVTWRVSSDKTVSYVGMQSGSFVEPRRDPRRASVSGDELVDSGLSSLKGSSADSLVHEAGHIIDHSVIGGRSGAASFPCQFPEFKKLLDEKNRVFGSGDSKVSQTDYGYISSYSKVNAQESFAEHFWAYIRDRKGFLARAGKETAQGHPELTQKFKFMEKLIDHTPATMERLSKAYLAKKELELKKQMAKDGVKRKKRQGEILKEYLARNGEKKAVVAKVEKQFGKPFHEFTNKDYARFMEGLNLDKDEDVWRWSHVTGIPILALTKTSRFFRVNAHVLEDVEAAFRMSSRQLYQLKSSYDRKTGQIQVKDASGKALPTRQTPKRTILTTARTSGFWHLSDFAEPRIVHEVLAPCLLPFRDLGYRSAIGGWIRSLPLSVVQVYRGKGIYFTTLKGRSYAPTMPVSNTTYQSHAGLQTGLYVEMRNDGPKGTGQNFVHEFGHILDYVVLKGGYGGYRAPHQFPEFRKLMPEKERVFGIRDDKVPQTPFGYISRYSKANAQESFAEHFRAYILEKEKFLKQAREEELKGHPELMEKFRFMEKLLDNTSTTMHRLSRKWLPMDARWTKLRGELSGLYSAQKLLEGDLVASLKGLMEDRLSLAFNESEEQDGASAARQKTFDALLRDVGRLEDKERSIALAALLGVKLDITFNRRSTTEVPAMTVTVRGATAGKTTGTVTCDMLPDGRSAPGPAPTPIALAAGRNTTIDWLPEAVEDADLSMFIARATADISWKNYRFALTKKVTGLPSIPTWHVIGPFDNPGGATADVKHPPETVPVDLEKTFKGRGGKVVKWKRITRDSKLRPDAEMVVDFSRLYGASSNVASYSVVRVHAAEKTDALFSFGSEDGAVVWVNGERKHSWLGGRRTYVSKGTAVPIQLRKGLNEILVKVTLSSRGWLLGAHLTDPDGDPLEGIRYNLNRDREPGNQQRKSGQTGELDYPVPSEKP